MQFRAVALALLLPVSLGAQAKELTYVPELSIDLSKERISRPGLLTVSAAGEMVLATGDWFGEIVAFDSSGRKLWSAPFGIRQRDSEIGWVNAMGWMGDSLWIEDTRYEQVVILDGTGAVVHSVERPSWVRPSWGDRRKYPLFSSMGWEAVYSDGSMLVVPTRPRALFDTPGFDRSMVHLLRVNDDGKILRTVARISAKNGTLELRDGTQRKSLRIPFFARSFFKTSADGKRVVVVQPLTTAGDSGAFVVTLLTENGDTVFSRRHTTWAKRISRGAIDSLLAPIKPYGRYSAEWIRDTIRKQVPAFDARIVNLGIGVDHSTWVWIRSEAAEMRALVIDARGELAGVAIFPPSMRQTSYSIDHLWRLERVAPPRGTDVQYALLRLKRAPTGAQRARSAPASTSLRPGRSPE